jgi:MFS family permease
MTTGAPALGLRANRGQFALLVLVNAFVGAMVGLERTVLPLLAEAEFGLASKSAVLSFIASFGITKAVANLAAGWLSDTVGRRPVLLAGWLVGLPVPFMIMWAPSWTWIVLANVLLGINQGLAWSTTVIMKIDLVGPTRRGLAMGLNEFSGYLAVGMTALGTGWIAARYGLRPEPFYLGIGIAVTGFLLSLVFVRETAGHAGTEAARHPARSGPAAGLRQVLVQSAWKDPALFSTSQAGLVNNLNDGVAWGLFPLMLAGSGFALDRIGVLAALYPVTWGIGQLVTGPLSDRWGRKGLIVSGMVVQGIALVAAAGAASFRMWVAVMVLLGLGTAMVYPTLLAAVADAAHPASRGAAVGVYRLWRDAGYAVGALLTGALADRLGMGPAIVATGGLTILSGLVVAVRMPGIRTDHAAS